MNNQTQTPAAITLTTLPPKATNSLLIRPVANNQEILAAWRNYQELKRDLLTQEDYQSIGGKQCIKKSGWRKLQTAFGLSDEVVKEERIAGKDPNQFTYEVTVKIIAQNGRFSYGLGSCSSTERKFAHPEHDVRSTAHTRAKNRGTSDLVGGGEVTAEELDAGNIDRPFQKSHVAHVVDVENGKENDYVPFPFDDNEQGASLSNHAVQQEPLEPSTPKQRDLILRLVDLKINDEQTKRHYTGNLGGLDKMEASQIIGQLLRM